ncbi:MAG TPA: hypothetical protein VH277_09285, partial [Gemmatimonadaceae bacterium]|nr:hypothetical protein [Gemmatimonadaceae bacterium]
MEVRLATTSSFRNPRSLFGHDRRHRIGARYRVHPTNSRAATSAARVGIGFLLNRRASPPE